MSPEAVLTADPEIIIATGSNWTYSPGAKGFVSLGYGANPEEARTQLRALTDAGLELAPGGQKRAVLRRLAPVLHLALPLRDPPAVRQVDVPTGVRRPRSDSGVAGVPPPLPADQYSGTFWVGLND